ncbi:MAG: DUF340 domain-containing protein [Firmicutes bacterium HGW-Firmicutes-7]|nr:MAG: DUF340 domain-containing protein [Firmicutes bacterium HGW-Firmicutes-7]
MGFRLVLYLSILAIGIFIGYKEISHKKLLARLNHLQMGALIALLFVMGIRIGADQSVVNVLGTLGIQAFVLASFSVLTSVLAVYIIRKVMHFNKKGERQ